MDAKLLNSLLFGLITLLLGCWILNGGNGTKWNLWPEFVKEYVILKTHEPYSIPQDPNIIYISWILLCIGIYQVIN